MLAPRPIAREIEIKLRVADLPALIRKLRRLHASCLGRVFERNTLYDTPGSELRRRGQLLRVRIATPAPSRLLRGGQSRAWITSKRPAPARRPSRGLSLYKVKLESEAVLPKVAGFASSLRSLGFRRGFLYEKFRTTFRLPGSPVAAGLPAVAGLHLDLDETPVGVFLELEGRPSAINRAARALGYSSRDYIRSTYWDLYAANCRRRGRIPRNMLFPA